MAARVRGHALAGPEEHDQSGVSGNVKQARAVMTADGQRAGQTGTDYGDRYGHLSPKLDGDLDIPEVTKSGRKKRPLLASNVYEFNTEFWTPKSW